MKMSRLIVLLTLAQGLLGCGSDGPVSPFAPTTAAGPTTMPAPLSTVTRIAIAGNIPLTRIGETAQLTATATFSDNLTKDVTRDGTWLSSDVKVVTVSPGGLLTVVGFGVASTSFMFQSRGAGITVTATPPGTFALTGRVREPGASGLANVRVVDTVSGRIATTDSNGNFFLAELPRLPAHLKAEKEGYEPAEVLAGQSYVDLPLQRIVRLTAGESVKPPALAPNDLLYNVGGKSCFPCRLIRVIVPQAGALQVRVTWTIAAQQLSLFTDAQVVMGANGELTAEVPTNAPREVLLYLGVAPPNAVREHTPFTIETSVR